MSLGKIARNFLQWLKDMARTRKVLNDVLFFTCEIL